MPAPAEPPPPAEPPRGIVAKVVAWLKAKLAAARAALGKLPTWALGLLAVSTTWLGRWSLLAKIGTLPPFRKIGEWLFGKEKQPEPATGQPPSPADPDFTDLTPDVRLEYWDGTNWARVTDLDAPELARLTLPGRSRLNFTVPAITPSKWAGQDGYWLRLRLIGGGYGRRREVAFADPDGTRTAFPVVEPRPPRLHSFRMGYRYASDEVRPEAALTFNDFQWRDETARLRQGGRPVLPFHQTEDRFPAIYLGFGGPIPEDEVSLFFDLVPRGAEDVLAPSPLVWEYHDGRTWKPLEVTDGTRDLTRPQLVTFVWKGTNDPLPVPVVEAAGTTVQLADPSAARGLAPGDTLFVRDADGGELVDLTAIAGKTLVLAGPLSRSFAGATVGVARLPRFGAPRTWVRARTAPGGKFADVTVRGIYPNAAFAEQAETITDEVLGSSTGDPGQQFRLRQGQVLPGEQIEVLELDGRRAEAELDILREEVARAMPGAPPLRVEQDAGRVVKVWVRWEERSDFTGSKPNDRHYVIERAGGVVLFGNDRQGRVPPVGTDNVLARRYRHGGGKAGNVPERAITQILSAAPGVQDVFNPLPGEGGGDADTLDPRLFRGEGEVADRTLLVPDPRSSRHLHRAVTPQDYEALAREASTQVALTGVLPGRTRTGAVRTGSVTVVVLPKSADPQPRASDELLRRVARYLTDRAPAAQAAGLSVIGAEFHEVGLDVVVRPTDAGDAGPTRQRVADRAAAFLHPLTGGPGSSGWSFGQPVFASDIAAVLNRVEGVAALAHIELRVNEIPAGEQVVVPAGRIVAAGPVRVRLAPPGGP